MEIILLDTDVTKRLQINNVLQPGEIGAVSLLTFFELPPHKRDIYDKFNLKTMLDFIEIVIYEEMTKNGLADELGEYFENFPLINLETENKFSLLRLDPDLYPKESKEMDSIFSDHEKAISLIWDRIPFGNKISRISIRDIDNEESNIFSHVINNFQNEADKLNRFVFEKFSKLIEKFGILQFKEDCPSSRALIRIQSFINVLSSKCKKNNHGKIHLSIEDNECSIPLKDNFFSDLKISAAYLPYISKFKTHDKDHSVILKKLFPGYEHKVDLLPQKNIIALAGIDVS